MSEDISPARAETPSANGHEEEPAHDTTGPSRNQSLLRKVLHRLKDPWLNNGWVSGILTGLITGALVAFYLSPTGQAAATAARDLLAKPTCSDPQWLLQVPDNQIFVSAFYMQKDTLPNYGEYHQASDTVDGNLGTSWLQFWPSYTTHLHKESSDYIEWSFPQNYDIRLICIVDGWTEDSNTYKATLPVGAATVYAAQTEIAPPSGPPAPLQACPSRAQSFIDYLGKNGQVGFAYQWQPIEFHCVTQDVVFHIDDVHNTSMAYRQPLPLQQLDEYHKPLVGISEIRFYYCPTALCMLPAN